MKAITSRTYGSPSVLQLEEMDPPVPKPGEILVRVMASTVNRTDCAILRAQPFIMRFTQGLFKPSKPVPGTDFAGVIEATAEDVYNFKPGDRIFGFDDSGLQSHAEYLTISAEKALARIPEKIGFQAAAASIEGAHYAYNFINKVRMDKNSHVLVNGATGAIGSAAVQLLKNCGVQISAVCGTKHLDLVRSLGADTVIDYQTDDFTQSVARCDFIFDTVGKSSFSKCKPLLKPGGAYISSELGKMSQNLFFALTTPWFSSKKVKFPLPLDKQASVDLVSKLLEEGKFNPVIDRTYTLEEVRQAYEYVGLGEKIGNVVITQG